MREQYYVCVHPEHSNAMEIFERQDFREARRLDNRYRILTAFPSRALAMDFVIEVLSKALTIDPELNHLKKDIQELYL